MLVCVNVGLVPFWYACLREAPLETEGILSPSVSFAQVVFVPTWFV